MDRTKFSAKNKIGSHSVQSCTTHDIWNDTKFYCSCVFILWGDKEGLLLVRSVTLLLE